MAHDFDADHRGKNCDGQGFMSYKNHPEAWSTCSNSDFVDWFRNKGHLCSNYGDDPGNDPANPIFWNGNWANACDFYENNLSNAKTSADKCGPQCESTSGCTHFTWTNHEGGTCWMKRGPVSKNDAFSTGDQEMVCGVTLKYV